MDGKGRWMDNVFIERLWRSLKYEDLYIKFYADGVEARAGIADWVHFTGAIADPAERLTAELKDKAGESVTPEVLKYLNRLSDYLFVASRYTNDKGAGDVLWKPGENR